MHFKWQWGKKNHSSCINNRIAGKFVSHMHIDHSFVVLKWTVVILFPWLKEKQEWFFFKLPIARCFRSQSSLTETFSGCFCELQCYLRITLLINSNPKKYRKYIFLTYISTNFLLRTVQCTESQNWKKNPLLSWLPKLPKTWNPCWEFEHRISLCIKYLLVIHTRVRLNKKD